MAQTPAITPTLLLQAYRHGVFPWSDRPARWYSPDPRSVFELDSLRFSRRLLRKVRQGEMLVTFDRAFSQVMQACWLHHHDSWLSNSMIAAYTRFHQMGYAHSVEVWRAERMVGGLYGVQIGAMFAGESMFHFEPDASKIAFYHLVRKLKDLGVVLFDSQVRTEHTASLGAIEIPRGEFLDRLEASRSLEVPQTSWAEEGPL